MDMDLTSAGVQLNTDVNEGLLNPPCNVIQAATRQEPKVPSSASKQISSGIKVNSEVKEGLTDPHSGGINAPNGQKKDANIVKKGNFFDIYLGYRNRAS